MKKFIFVFICIAVALPVFAQVTISENNASEFYYFNVWVEKVYPSNTGYIVMYRQSANKLGKVGIPNEWFTDAAGKAELIILPSGKNWPSMTVFYKNGEFSHIRLYVHRQKSHGTWGNIPMATDVSSYFQDTDNFTIEF